MKMTEPLTIMLVDDHAVVRAGYRLLLGQTPGISVSCEAATGEDACATYLTNLPRVVLMDLNLPGMGGLESTRRIIGRDPKARILISSIHDEPLYVYRALDAGAMGYVSKSCSPETLIKAVLTCAKGQPFIDPVIQSRTGDNSPASRMDPLTVLTVREFDVFCLLVKGYSTRETADK